MRNDTGRSWKIRSIICLLSLAFALASSSARADPQWASQWAPKTVSEFEAYAAVLTNDYEKAATLLKPMAEKGNALAQGALGQFYLKGLGVKQDFVQAMRWLEKASANGDSESSFTLAIMSETGVGATKDQVRAARMLEKASEQRNKKAPILLALKYYEGVGVPKDKVFAHAWSNIGAAFGDEDSKKLRDEIEKMMSISEVQEAQRAAREWFARHKSN